MSGDIASAAEPRQWPFRIGVIVAVLQGISLLAVAVPGLIVSYAFCDPSGDLQAGYCGIRGPRWFAWVGLQLILLLAIPLLVATVVSSRRSQAARHRLMAIEGVVLVAGAVTFVLADETAIDYVVSVGLVLLLGAIVVLTAWRGLADFSR